MQRISLGFKVVDLRGRTMGTVTGLLGDCFQVKRDRPPRTWNLTQESIFNVIDGEVTLVCDAEELERYPCPVHIP